MRSRTKEGGVSFGGGNKLTRWCGFRDGVWEEETTKWNKSGDQRITLDEYQGGGYPCNGTECKDGAPGHKVIEVGV